MRKKRTDYKIECDICNRQIRSCSYKKHYNFCYRNKSFLETKRNCKKCGNEFTVVKNGRKGSLINYCSLKCRNSHSRDKESRNKSSIARRKFLDTSYGKELAKTIGKKCRETWKKKSIDRKVCSVCGNSITKANKFPYCKEHWFESEEFKKVTGHNRNYIKGYYFNKWLNKNIWLESSLEIEFAKQLDKLNEPWIKPDYLTYFKNGKRKMYFPDFYLKNRDIYIEVKGYWWKNDLEKMQLVRENNKEITILVIGIKEIKDITVWYNGLITLGFEPREEVSITSTVTQTW